MIRIKCALAFFFIILTCFIAASVSFALNAPLSDAEHFGMKLINASAAVDVSFSKEIGIESIVKATPAALIINSNINSPTNIKNQPLEDSDDSDDMVDFNIYDFDDGKISILFRNLSSNDILSNQNSENNFLPTCMGVGITLKF